MTATFLCRCGATAWAGLRVGREQVAVDRCESCGDSPFFVCRCGYVEGDIPRDSDLGHEELCPVLNPELARPAPPVHSPWVHRQLANEGVAKEF